MSIRVICYCYKVWYKEEDKEASKPAFLYTDTIRYNNPIVNSSILSISKPKYLLIQPRYDFSLEAALTHCWLGFKLLETIIPKFLPHKPNLAIWQRYCHEIWIWTKFKTAALQKDIICMEQLSAGQPTKILSWPRGLKDLIMEQDWRNLGWQHSKSGESKVTW